MVARNFCSIPQDEGGEEEAVRNCLLSFWRPLLWVCREIRSDATHLRKWRDAAGRGVTLVESKGEGTTNLFSFVQTYRAYQVNSTQKLYKPLPNSESELMGALARLNLMSSFLWHLGNRIRGVSLRKDYGVVSLDA